MTEQLIFAMTFASALGCGLNAGVFFAFSAFVMKALARLPAPQGIAAMQSINVMAVTPLFMAALFGTGLLCLALAVISVVTWGDQRARWLLAGSALHLGGNIGATLAATCRSTTRSPRSIRPARRAPGCGPAISGHGPPGTTCGRSAA